MNSNKTKLYNTLSKPVLAGVVGAIAAQFLLGENGAMVLFNTVVSAPLAIGGTIAVATVAGEVLGNYALPLIKGNKIIAGSEKMIVEPLMTGLSAVALMKLTSNSPVPLLKPLFLGAASNVAGAYAAETLRPFIVR